MLVALWERQCGVPGIWQQTLCELGVDSVQQLALLAGRDGRPRPANRQDAVVPLRLAQAAGEVVAQVVVADGFAGGQRAVAKHQERLAPAHPLHLA